MKHLTTTLRLISAVLAAVLGAATGVTPGVTAAPPTPRNTANAESPLADGVYLVHSEPDLDSGDIIVPDGYRRVVYDYYYYPPENRPPARVIILPDTPSVPMTLAGPPEQTQSESGQIQLFLSLAARYAGALERLTAENIMRKVAIVIGGRVVTLHKIRSKITGGKIQITRCSDNGCEIIRNTLTHRIDP